MRSCDRHSAGRFRVLALGSAFGVLAFGADGGASAQPSPPPAAEVHVRPLPGAARAVGRYPSIEAHVAALSTQRVRTFRAPASLPAVATVPVRQDVRVTGVVRQDGRLALVDCAHRRLDLERVTGDLTQGGTLVASGSCFGKSAGVVKMLGAFPNGAVPLVVQSWTSDTVTAKVPALTGVPDQPVTIEVSAPGEGGQMKTSAGVPMVFVSRRRIANVSAMVENLTCAPGQHPKHPGYSTDGFGYVCNGLAIVNWSITCSDGVHLQLAPDAGADRWRVRMQPGWRFDHIDVSEQADVVIDPTIDPTNVSWTSNWHTVTSSWNEFSGGSGQQSTIQKFSYDGSYIVTVYGSGPV